MKKILILLVSFVVFYFTLDAWDSRSAPISIYLLNVLSLLGLIGSGFSLGIDVTAKILPLAVFAVLLSPSLSAQSGVDLSERFQNNQTYGSVSYPVSTHQCEPLPSHHNVCCTAPDNTLLWVIFAMIYIGFAILTFVQFENIHFSEHFTYTQWLVLKSVLFTFWPLHMFVILLNHRSQTK